jgi:hypothetical protein
MHNMKLTGIYQFKSIQPIYLGANHNNNNNKYHGNPQLSAS